MAFTLIMAIDDLIARRQLLDHPFYSAWSAGALTPEDLREYATQYYRWVQAFPTWLSATHANTSDFGARQEILENLIDEERGPDNHPELWLRFCDALGLDRAVVTDAPLLPETAAALGMMRTVCRDQPAVAGLAALYAYESQQPTVMQTKLEGLRTHYGVDTGHDYFEVHATKDVEHSAGERRLVQRHASGHEAAVIEAVTTALDATYAILDGVERRRLERRSSER
jgi:pyrroloquinoline-quinone synthase